MDDDQIRRIVEADIPMPRQRPVGKWHLYDSVSAKSKKEQIEEYERRKAESDAKHAKKLEERKKLVEAKVAEYKLEHGIGQKINDMHELTTQQRSAISFAGESAWNVREWMREAVEDPTLDSVLDFMLTEIRRTLELRLLDAGYSQLAIQLPSERITGASFIHSVQHLDFGQCRLSIPEGKPPLSYEKLARIRSKRIAMQLIDNEGALVFNAENSADLETIESMDATVLSELWEGCENVQMQEFAGESPTLREIMVAYVKASGKAKEKEAAVQPLIDQTQWKSFASVKSAAHREGITIRSIKEANSKK